MSSMSGRKINALEQKIHQAALASPQSMLAQKDAEAIAPDATARTNAVNFLLGTGLLRVMKDAKGVLFYRAVAKKELEVKKDLVGEESLVLSHIQAASTEGIWTKHLKAKTELHQTVIDRCLKSLVQKQLIKSIKNVKHPTRKVYMLYHLEPSVDVTGGPWYTDNELDTEFIKLLSSACLRFIRDRSFPRANKDSQTLFPLSASPPCPTAQQIQAFLSKSRITETQLTVDHVEMLLNVLIYDGEVEKVPAFGAALWEANALADGPGSDSEGPGSKRKRKVPPSASPSKRRKKSGPSSASDSEIVHDDLSPEISKSEHEMDTNYMNDDSQEGYVGAGRPYDNVLDEDYGGAYVYRAIRQETVSLGWAQAPCGRCPQFDFCSEKGPVNPRECEYYGEWLGRVIA